MFFKCNKSEFVSIRIPQFDEIALGSSKLLWVCRNGINFPMSSAAGIFSRPKAEERARGSRCDQSSSNCRGSSKLPWFVEIALGSAKLLWVQVECSKPDRGEPHPLSLKFQAG